METLQFFLGKYVTVKGYGCEVEGVMTFVKQEEKFNHHPQLLVLQTESGSNVLIRSWEVIALKNTGPKTNQANHAKIDPIRRLKVNSFFGNIKR